MEREKAAELVEMVLERLDKGKATWPLSLASEVAVCGSFARGAVQPNDVDLSIVRDHGDGRWVSHFATCLCGRARSVHSVSEGIDRASTWLSARLRVRRSC